MNHSKVPKSELIVIILMETLKQKLHAFGVCFVMFSYVYICTVI